MKSGDIVLLDFPGHGQHGSRVQVIRIAPQFNIAPPDSDPCLCEVVFVQHPDWPNAVGIGRERIGGTVENAKLRQAEREDEGEQGELLL